MATARKTSYMPVDEEHNLKCHLWDCIAGLGLAGSGICFLGGNWANPDCGKFVNEMAWYLERCLDERMSQYAGEVG